MIEGIWMSIVRSPRTLSMLFRFGMSAARMACSAACTSRVSFARMPATSFCCDVAAKSDDAMPFAR